MELENSPSICAIRVIRGSILFRGVFGLTLPVSSRRLAGNDCSTESLATYSQREQRPADQIEGDIRPALFQHGDARLTGADSAGELLLRYAALKGRSLHLFDQGN